MAEAELDSIKKKGFAVKVFIYLNIKITQRIGNHNSLEQY